MKEFLSQYLNRKFLMENKEKVAKIAVAGLIIIVALFVFLFRTGNQEDIIIAKDKETVQREEKSEEESLPSSQIIADVGGAVNRPMVVELKAGSRVGDAIEAAGGLKEDADITNVNRAAPVNDGDKIYIPKKGEESSGSEIGGVTGSSQGGSASTKGKVNINTATTDELQTVTGIGPVTAEKILLYRA